MKTKGNFQAKRGKYTAVTLINMQCTSLNCTHLLQINTVRWEKEPFIMWFNLSFFPAFLSFTSGYAWCEVLGIQKKTQIKSYFPKKVKGSPTNSSGDVQTPLLALLREKGKRGIIVFCILHGTLALSKRLMIFDSDLWPPLSLRVSGSPWGTTTKDLWFLSTEHVGENDHQSCRNLSAPQKPESLLS